MLATGASTEKLNQPDMGAEVAPNAGQARKRKIWLLIALVVAVLAIAGAIVGALIGKNVIHVNKASTSNSALGVAASSAGPTQTSSDTKSTSTSPSTTSTSKPSATCSSSKDIPKEAKGTWMDPTSWLDMKDFNCTFTSQTVGDLPLVGLNDTWDDSKQPNANVPALNSSFGYGTRPFRGVNIGGWLSLEPFITPSLFEGDPSIVDEYTLSAKLGKTAAAVLEKHYSTFVTEDDFKAIAAAGLDHVRIPYSYWAVKKYDSDPYVFGVSWRYLLRGIEWARKHGLRVKLDLHALPGSQNGWNHSGRSGKINWIAGPDGATNAQRSLDLHNQLSKFFAQPRYKNVVAFYGLVNEPANTIPQDALVAWTKQAIDLVKRNNLPAIQIFSEGMRGLGAWNGKFPGHGNDLVIDVHEYTLFDDATVGFKHADRVAFACTTWTSAIAASPNPAMVGEWSQADTDCTKHLNGVGSGSRWEGSFLGKNKPRCPTQNSQCSCDLANAPISAMSDEYKLFLREWAQAQMWAFEKSSWGWFYWTWKTEDAPLWSYRHALEGGILPAQAYARDWGCERGVSSYGGLPEYY